MCICLLTHQLSVSPYKMQAPEGQKLKFYVPHPHLWPLYTSTAEHEAIIIDLCKPRGPNSLATQCDLREGCSLEYAMLWPLLLLSSLSSPTFFMLSHVASWAFSFILISLFQFQPMWNLWWLPLTVFLKRSQTQPSVTCWQKRWAGQALGMSNLVVEQSILGAS